ncbi:MAG TPA: transglutaminase domain-containing protein [Thermoanaerobaculia bacterium]|nr:transglutaminase domain-containing protein [Thermoanaerobaculia bacterium]
MKKLCAAAVLVVSGAALVAGTKTPAVRSFEATYVGTIAALPATARKAEVWIPLPSDGPYQSVADVKVQAPAPYTLETDSAGNRLAHFVLDKPEQLGKDLEVKATYRVTRREALAPSPGGARGAEPPGAAELLKPNRLVPLTPRVKELARTLSAGKTDAVAKARAFYDYLVDNGTYDKTAPGWGKGDSERFCDVKKGNCTDFHSAFMALARAEGIPVRFSIGFPLKAEKEGSVPGYHCWAEFWAPGQGWIPVDASDAAKTKEPVKKAYLFGNLDPDRYDITTGRDLTLSPPQKDGPLNFFIYPYVEVDGKAFAETKIRLDYRDL